MKKTRVYLGILLIAILLSAGFFVVNFWKNETLIAPSAQAEVSSFSGQVEQTLDSLDTMRAEITKTKAQNTRILLVQIDRKISILARKNLPLYALRRYSNPDEKTLTLLTNAYKNLRESDPKANLAPKYLLSLGNRLTLKTTSIDTDEEFLAYAYIIRKLKETGRNMQVIQTDIQKASEDALAIIDKDPKSSSFSEADSKELESVFAQIGKNPWNAGHLHVMRSEIIKEQLGPNTRYFRAYALAKLRNTVASRFLSVGNIPHAKQKYALSCEANSLTDLVNYYRTRSGKNPIDEETFILMLPSYKEIPKVEKVAGRSIRIWGDPDKEFVGSIYGVQSANPNKFSGYGIHADGILPLAKRALRSSEISINKGDFDEGKILESLYKGNPVMFWYVHGSAFKMMPSQIEWKTRDGKMITGYVGEHTGIITGAELDANGNITTIHFYEWQTEEEQKMDFSALRREAKWFDTALYIENS